MGLVRNLKKKLNNLADKVLAELSYHYMIQKARQTTKRPDNSSVTMSLRKDLTMEPPDTTIATSFQDTSEKTTMNNMMTTDTMVAYLRNWSINKVETAKNIGDKDAIYKEFEEWIEIEEGDEDLEIMSIDADD
jgi:hypothetical protein